MSETVSKPEIEALMPRTRSGRIMRRPLRDIAEGRVPGDTTTPAAATVVASIRQDTGKAED